MGQRCNYIRIGNENFTGAKILPVDMSKGNYILCIPDSPNSFSLRYDPSFNDFYNEGVIEGFEKTSKGIDLLTTGIAVTNGRKIYSSGIKKYFN